MYERMHLELCDGCERHAQIMSAATEALLAETLAWFGMHASMRPGAISVSETLANQLERNSLDHLQRLERRIDELTERRF